MLVAAFLLCPCRPEAGARTNHRLPSKSLRTSASMLAISSSSLCTSSSRHAASARPPAFPCPSCHSGTEAITRPAARSAGLATGTGGGGGNWPPKEIGHERLLRRDSFYSSCRFSGFLPMRAEVAARVRFLWEANFHHLGSQGGFRARAGGAAGQGSGRHRHTTAGAASASVTARAAEVSLTKIGSRGRAWKACYPIRNDAFDTPPLPARIGPVQLGELGRMARCAVRRSSLNCAACRRRLEAWLAPLAGPSASRRPAGCIWRQWPSPNRGSIGRPRYSRAQAFDLAGAEASDR